MMSYKARIEKTLHGINAAIAFWKKEAERRDNPFAYEKILMILDTEKGVLERLLNDSLWTPLVQIEYTSMGVNNDA